MLSSEVGGAVPTLYDTLVVGSKKRFLYDVICECSLTIDKCFLCIKKKRNFILDTVKRLNFT